MNGTFYEQLGGVAGVFEQWGACERTVVACALAKRVPWPGLKLLQRAVDAALSQHVDDERLERDANDETYLAVLLAGRTDDDDHESIERFHQLLSLLPLLRTDNERAKDVYVSSAPALVQRCVDGPRRSLVLAELCRQLLSYLLVHPALTHHDQRTLTQWLRYLENYLSNTNNTGADNMWHQRLEPPLLSSTNIWSSNTFRRTIGKNVEFRTIIDSIESYNIELQESFSKNGRDVDISSESDKLTFEPAITQPKSQRSNSLTPPSSNFLTMSSSAENLSDEPFVQKPRSFSLSSEHSLSQLRPISALFGTTGSETRLDDLRYNNLAEHPGMSMVPQWLKSLRLHKYVWLFSNISYEQMLAMDDEYLEKLGVTKGARHKLLLSIRKLCERSAMLAALRAEISASPTPSVAALVLHKLTPLLHTPMPSDDALPKAIVGILDLAAQCIQPGSSTAPSSEDGHDHDHVDPLSLHCWLVEKALQHGAFRSPEVVSALRSLKHRLPPRQYYRHVSDLPHRRHYKNRCRVPPLAVTGRAKSHSYPPAPPDPSLDRHDPRLDYSRLDALCLQMADHAIN